MRTFSIRDDIEQIALQLVKAVPDVFLEDGQVELVEDHEDGLVYFAEIVLVESEETELVIGEVRLGSDLILEVDIY